MKKFASLFYKPDRNERAIKAKRWNIWAILGKAIRKTCTVIGAMVLISTIISVFLLSKLATNPAPSLPNDMVLLLDLENGISETQLKPSLMDPFPFLEPTLRNVISALERAEKDARVRGLIVKLNGASINVAHTQELREAVKRFKTSGKFAKVFSPSYTDPMGGLNQYYFATAFDEIWMQPVGMVSISGINMEMPFAKNLLSEIGIGADFFQREEYKSAMENFTNSEISPANKNALQSLLNDLSMEMVKEISADRKINSNLLNAQINKGILTGKEALQAKLLDRLDYGDVMWSEIRKKATGNPDDETIKLVRLNQYAQSKEKPITQKAKETESVALIYVVGTIVDHAGANGNAGADEISETIAKAYSDDNIKAIVVRIDSPGGSPTASETIRRALVKAKEKGKKVVVSMGSVAASGGYWIATDADKIFASNGTITGSIGVVMGKFEGEELFKKFGVNWQGPKFGENADIWSIHKKFDEKAKQRMNFLIDDVYNSFLTRVANGRNLSIEQARSVAKGRAWTGKQALKQNLVDEIGGLNTALDKTAEMIGQKDRHDLKVIKMPRELNGVERILELFGQQVSLGNFLGVDLGFLKPFQSQLKQKEILESGTRTSVYQTELEAFR